MTNVKSIAGDDFSKQHHLTFTPRSDGEFDINRVKPVENLCKGETDSERLRFRNKPDGGFWLSMDGGWEEWCRYEEPEWLAGDTYSVTLTPEARVLYIDSVTQLRDIVLRCPLYTPGYYGECYVPDFDALSQDYDAMFVAITSGEVDLYNALYGWDCDSGVVFNSDAIASVENMRTQSVVYSKSDDYESTVASPDDVKVDLLDSSPSSDISYDIDYLCLS